MKLGVPGTPSLIKEAEFKYLSTFKNNVNITQIIKILSGESRFVTIIKPQLRDDGKKEIRIFRMSISGQWYFRFDRDGGRNRNEPNGFTEEQCSVHPE